VRLRIVSYNIHRAIGSDRRFRPDRVVRILENHDADLVLLQEVDNGVPRSRRMDMARELAKRLGYDYVAEGMNVTLREGRYGNATLSKHPIRKSRNINLSVGRKKGRGCQHATVEIPANGSRQTVEVFNLHLGLSARERRQQLGLLVSAREFASLDASTPCIVGGDFNDWRSQLQEPFVRVLQFHCATARDEEAAANTCLKTYPAFSPQGALDRVYFRGDLSLVSAYRCRHQASKVASDHLPIIVDFELAPNGADGGR
jgi:endonuclease/exonuclease/phosphatase family metal-dependent hydrolase